MTPKNQSTTQKPAGDQQLIALAFKRNGDLLSRGKVDGNAAYFELKERELRNARVFILPEPEDKTWLGSMNLQRAEQLSAFEPHLKLNPKGGLVFDQIPNDLVLRWHWRRCCVRGRITNRASVEGRQTTFPVCNATVHVCEIDRWWNWLDRIPHDLLERLRRGLIERIPDPRPDLIPDLAPNFPPPIPVPFPNFRAADLDTSRLSDLRVLDQVITPRIEIGQLTQVTNLLQRQNVEQFRFTLRDQYPILRPYLCFFPYIWPYFYHREEVATVQTDNNGRYDACFWHQESKPDIYLWIEYPFVTGLQTVYRPNLTCNTRWDYDCGTDLNVQLSDSRIPPICGERLEGTSVAIRAIGHTVSPLEIEQDMNAQIAVPGNTEFETVGLTNFGTSSLENYSPSLVNQHVRPYTSNFPLIAQFGDALPATGIHYFQVQYRRISNAALDALINPDDFSFGWKPLNSGPLSRTYVIQQGLDFKYLPYSLGPFIVNGQAVYRIPPFDPQLNGIDGEPASSDPSARWTQYDRVGIGRVASDALDGDGLYEFRIRFLDGSANLANVPASFFRVPNSDETMAAPAAFIRTLGDDAVFQFRLRIDTATTTAEIEGVSLDGDPDAMSDCGFVEYRNTDQRVGLTFTAAHPRNFAVFNFNLERGRRLATTNHFALGDAAGMVSGDKVPYALDADGKYQASFSVADLINGCGGKAAFSESLRVIGLHTDGQEAGVFFHKSVNNSFALAPAPAPEG